MTDELKLIKKAQKGDASAFEEIIKKYQAVVFSITYRYADNAEDAADMAQEVFLKLFRNINSFQFKSKLSTWIYRVTTNTCLDIIKKNRKDAGAYSIDDTYTDEEGNSVLNEVADTAPTPDEAAERAEIKDAVNAAIAQLPDDYRTVIILRDIRGLSYDEIAEILDCSLGTVKSRISRGRKNLREILQADGELFDRFFV